MPSSWFDAVTRGEVDAGMMGEGGAGPFLGLLLFLLAWGVLAVRRSRRGAAWSVGIALLGALACVGAGTMGWHEAEAAVEAGAAVDVQAACDLLLWWFLVGAGGLLATLLGAAAVLFLVRPGETSG